MNKLKFIKKYVKNERQSLLRALDAAEEARDSAPSAMQSWSDTTRNQTEKLVFALKKKLDNLENVASTIPDNTKSISTDKISLWNYTEVKLGNLSMKLLVVPENISGKVVKKIRLISLESPLGKELMGKGSKSQFQFNNQKGEIIVIE